VSEPPKATTGSASQDDAWWEKTECPAGSERFGGPPPGGTEIGCKTAKGKLEGRFVRFHDNGKKAEEGQYENNLALGVWTAWNADGTRHLETNYQGGQKAGLETEWYPGGTIKSQREFSGGKRDGLTTIWDESGQKRTAMTYRHAKPSGLEVRWDETGQVAKVIDHGSP
jgi:antitoxin component YwqK of YwqJK toxin-antitoxin module